MCKGGTGCSSVHTRLLLLLASACAHTASAPSERAVQGAAALRGTGSSQPRTPGRAEAQPANEGAAAKQSAAAGARAALPEEVQAGRAASACRCGDRGCSCDLSAFADLDSVLLPLAYDRCVDDGECEACSGEERRASLCGLTGWRQRVACVRCNAAPSPFCLPGLSVFWPGNETVPPEGASTSGGGANASEQQAGATSGIFFRSCRSPALANLTSTTGALVRTPLRLAPRDESAEVVAFLALTAAVLAISGSSLRRQQRAALQETLQALYGPIDGGGSAAAPGAAAPRREGKAVERRSGSGHHHYGARDVTTAVVPEKLGRSIETLAEAVVRTGSAIELAVTGSGSAGAAQKMK